MTPSGYCLFHTALGACGIAWDERALLGVQLPEATDAAGHARMRRRFPELAQGMPPSWVEAAMRRIQALLQGTRDDLLDLPLQMAGVPPFNQRVYAMSRAIPPGSTLTYGEVARRLGDPGAARAVGQALGHNPFAPVVPCHRVLAARNASGGFSAEGGVTTKLRMLEIERAQLGPEPGLFD